MKTASKCFALLALVVLTLAAVFTTTKTAEAGWTNQQRITVIENIGNEGGLYHVPAGETVIITHLGSLVNPASPNSVTSLYRLPAAGGNEFCASNDNNANPGVQPMSTSFTFYEGDWIYIVGGSDGDHDGVCVGWRHW